MFCKNVDRKVLFRLRQVEAVELISPQMVVSLWLCISTNFLTIPAVFDIPHPNQRNISFHFPIYTYLVHVEYSGLVRKKNIIINKLFMLLEELSAIVCYYITSMICEELLPFLRILENSKGF